MLSTFVSVPALTNAPSVTSSLPAGEVDDVGAAQRLAQGDRRSAALPPSNVSMFATVMELAKLPRTSLSLPTPRSTDASNSCAPERDGVGAGAANQRLDVAQRTGVGEVPKRELVVAGAEIDDGRCPSAVTRETLSAAPPPMTVSTLPTVSVLDAFASVSPSLPPARSTEALDVAEPRTMWSAQRIAGDGFGVRHCRRVGEVAELHRVEASAQIERPFEICVAKCNPDRRRSCQRQVSTPSKPCRCWRTLRASAYRRCLRPRLIEFALLSAAPIVTVSAAVPPVSVSVFETVSVLAKLPRVRVSEPEPRSTVLDL